MAFPAFFDACVLYGATLNDLILWLADAGAFRPLWSEKVLQEVRRNVIAHGYSDSEIDKRLDTMRDYFPDAAIDGFESLEIGLTCHPKDRHVLAAAIRANAAVLVTFNLRDFPPTSTEPFNIDVVHPDAFLLDQLDLYPGIVTRTVFELLESYDSPPVSVDEYLQMLHRSGVPQFAVELRRHLG